LSLVVTTYNRPDALDLVLQSVERQGVLPDEVIVADDGSGPETKAVVDRFRERLGARGCLVVHAWQPDEGFRVAAARNRAIAMATGEYVVTIDGDIVIHPEFVRAHRRFARRETYVQGSRVLLSEAFTREAIATGRTAFSPFSSGMGNRLNATYFPPLAALIARLPTKQDTDWRTRSCHMAFWRDDAVRINGFDEDFVGWGHEDSDFAARLMHSGVRRRNLKFAAIAYHLHHPAFARGDAARNHAMYEATVAEQRVVCENGLSKYLDVSGGGYDGGGTLSIL